MRCEIVKRGQEYYLKVEAQTHAEGLALRRVCQMDKVCVDCGYAGVNLEVHTDPDLPEKDCPYPMHASDCDCRGMGGNR